MKLFKEIRQFDSIEKWIERPETGCWIFDPEFVVSFSNMSGALFCGSSPKFLNGKKLEDILSETDSGELAANIREAAKSRHSILFEWSPIGKLPIYLFRVRPAKDFITVNFSQIDDYYETSRIGEEVRAEKSLKSMVYEKPNLLAILESTSESIWSIDTRYLITYANKIFKEEYAKAFNIHLSHGMNALHGLPDNLAETWKTRYDQVFTNQSIQVVDCFDLPTGSSYYSITIHPILSNNIVVGASIYSRDITKQKVAEIELIKTKEILEQAGEMAKVGAFEVNPVTQEVVWSEMTRKIHEVPADYSITISEGIRFYKKSDRPQIEAVVNRAIRKGTDYDGEHQLITYTGKRKWIRLILKSEFRDKVCLRLYGTFQDITDRKLSFEMQQQFIEEAPTAIAMFDKQMCYLACSKKWKEDYNIRQIDLKGKSHYEVFPEIGEEWRSIHQTCLTGESMEREEDMFVREDGTVNWNRWRINPWHESQEKIGGIIMLTEDITQRKLATYRAIQFSRIFDKAVYEIYLLNTETYHFMQVNAAAQANLGYTMEELVKMRPTEIIPNLTLERFEEIIQPLRQGSKDKIILQEIHRRKDGTTYPVEIHLQYILVENDAYFVGFILDITEKTIYLSAIEEQNKILKEIAWVQSHVLRAPLSRMMMLLMLLENDDIEYHPNDLLKSKKDVVQAISKSASELDTIIFKIIAKIKELENLNLPVESCSFTPKLDGLNAWEVLLVDHDELSQLVNRYTIIQHGLHDKPMQFWSCQSVWEYLLLHDRDGKNYLILVDLTELETNASKWLETLQKESLISKIAVALLVPEHIPIPSVSVKKYPFVVGVFQNPLKKQQIEELKNLVHLFGG